MKKRLLILVAAVFTASLATAAAIIFFSGSSLFKANVKAMATTITIGIGSGKTESYNMYKDSKELTSLVCGCVRTKDAKTQQSVENAGTLKLQSQMTIWARIPR